MSSLSGVLVVVKRLVPPLPTRIDMPCASGRLGLIVATSNVGVASAGISFGGGGGSGMVHAVAGVARAKFRGAGVPPWLHVPEIESPSALTFPSYSPPIAAIAILTVEPC